MKQICKKCYSIFDEKEDKQIFICPHCKTKNKVIPQDNLIVEKYFKKANEYLCEKTEYTKSYNLFLSLYEFDRNNIQVYFGIIFSLLFKSDYRKSFIKESNDFLINSSKNISLGKKRASILSKYIKIYFDDLKFYSNSLIEMYIRNNKICKSKNKAYLLNSVQKEIIRFDEFYLELFESLKELSNFFIDSKETIEKDLAFRKSLDFNKLGDMTEEERLLLVKNKNLKKEAPIFNDNSTINSIKNILKIFGGISFLTAFTFMFFVVIKELKAAYPWGSVVCLASLCLFILIFFLITRLKSKKTTFDI